MAAISSSAILTSFSVLSPNLKEVNRVSISTLSGNIPSCYKAVARDYRRTTGNCLITQAKTSIQPEVYMEGVIHKVVPVEESTIIDGSDGVEIVSIHHVGLLCENLERSLDFYQNILGLKKNEARPNDKLPYRGAWLWVGSEMIHLMELPNPDPLTGRPEHGGRDRHACIAIRDVSKLKEVLDKAGIPYTLSKSGRPAIFTRDPDANALEFTQV